MNPIMNVAHMECHPYCLAIPEMSEQEYQELKGDIAGSGQLEPIVLFAGQILDGRHRYRACLELGIEPWFKEFDGPDSLLDYVVSANLRRRHLTESQRAMAMASLCKLERGRPALKAVEAVEAEAENREISPITKAIAAEKAGVDPKTMHSAMKVDRHGAPELVEAVKQGRVSVSAAAKVVDAVPGHAQQVETLQAAQDQPRKIVQIAKETAAKPRMRGEYATLDQWKAMSEDEQAEFLHVRDHAFKFNRQGDTADDSMGNIEWAQWSWNPVTGCMHDCPYCYARDIADRFYEQKFAPSFWPGRLAAPKNMRVPAGAEHDISKRNVFSNSMSDLYGRWVPREWIDAVLETMRGSPEWNFLMLTKFPKRAAEFEYAENCWIGTSVDMQARVKGAEDAFERIECGVKWLSLEPMIEPLTFSRPELFNWVVIGGASKSTQTPEWVPPAEWIVRVASQFLDHGASIYLKTNGRPREYPGVITPSTADEVFHYLKRA